MRRKAAAARGDGLAAGRLAIGREVQAVTGRAGKRTGAQRPGQDAAPEPTVLVQDGGVSIRAGEGFTPRPADQVVPAQGAAPDRAAGVELDADVAVELGGGGARMGQRQDQPRRHDERTPSVHGADDTRAPGAALDNATAVPVRCTTQ